MTFDVIGVDPGANGAFAYLTGAGGLYVEDMPTLEIKVGKSLRKRVDATAVWEYFELAALMGCRLVVMEEVAARPQQSGMFAFGWSCGLVYMACIAAGLKIDMVRPQVWKKALKVPGKGTGDDNSDAVLQRANEIFPEFRGLFYGPKGGKLVDRAEAAMIAKYATLTGEKT